MKSSESISSVYKTNSWKGWLCIKSTNLGNIAMCFEQAFYYFKNVGVSTYILNTKLVSIY